MKLLLATGFLFLLSSCTHTECQTHTHVETHTGAVVESTNSYTTTSNSTMGGATAGAVAGTLLGGRGKRSKSGLIGAGVGALVGSMNNKETVHNQFNVRTSDNKLFVCENGTCTAGDGVNYDYNSSNATVSHTSYEYGVNCKEVEGAF